MSINNDIKLRTYLFLNFSDLCLKTQYYKNNNQQNEFISDLGSYIET